jgi:hypothetical protein
VSISGKVVKNLNINLKSSGGYMDKSKQELLKEFEEILKKYPELTYEEVETLLEEVSSSED